MECTWSPKLKAVFNPQRKSDPFLRSSRKPMCVMQATTETMGLLAPDVEEGGGSQLTTFKFAIGG